MRNTDTRIIYMGTPAFAVPALAALHESGGERNREVVGVVTQPDRPAGRGKRPAPQRAPLPWQAAETGAPVSQEMADIAASFQEAVVDVLVEKVLRASARTGRRRLIVGGGVACNSRLRDRLTDAAEREGLTLHLPPTRYCPDNAAMVAGLGYHLCREGKTADLRLDAAPR